MIWLSLMLAGCGEKDEAPASSEEDIDADADGASKNVDCDDSDPLIHPDAPELCDGLDNDCDGEVDEDVSTTFYADSDGDTYGDPDAPLAACEAPDGHVADSTDCDDSSADASPDGVEVCDGLDNDCDGEVDEEAADAETWYADSDGDTYGDPDAPLAACEAPDGHVADSTDCDDTDAAINPDAEEVSGDWLDNDCDGDRGSAEIDLSEVDIKLIGEPVSFAGASMSAAGDVNGDGAADILIGAYGYNSYQGAAYLVLGPVSGEQQLTDAAARLIGEGDSDLAGYSVSGAGDVNADGFDDLLIGAHKESGSYGAAYLILGPVSGSSSLSIAEAKFTAEESLDYAGSSVSGAGDVNDDGFDDLLIGASGNDWEGAAYLLLGPVSGTSSLAEADAKLIGDSIYDIAGDSVSGAGDVNGDGFADLLVGDWNHDSEAGATYLVFGPVTGELDLSVADAEFAGESPGDRAGDEISGAGDVNGDGLDDILIGARYEDEGGTDTKSGAAYLVLGSADGFDPEVNLAEAEAKLNGEANIDSAGKAVSDAGDVDGDGFDDLLIGAPFEETAGSYAGAVYLVLGPISGTHSLSEADAKFIGETADSFTGWATSGAGDMNADGLADILISSHADDTGGDFAGAVYLMISPY